MPYNKGSTSQSVTLLFADDNGLPLTGKIAADFPPIYWSRVGPSSGQLISLVDLLNISSAYALGGIKEKNDGRYRLDVPDTIFVEAGIVDIYGDSSNKHILCQPLDILDTTQAQILDVVVEQIGELQPYNTLDELQAIFDTKLFTDSWDFSDNTNRLKASCEATRTLNTLRYLGSKTDSSQLNEAPRTIVRRNTTTNCNETVDLDCISDFKLAHADEVLALLDGINPEKERTELVKTSTAFASIRNSYDRTFILDHIKAGFASSSAFARIRRFIDIDNPIRLSRIS